MQQKHIEYREWLLSNVLKDALIGNGFSKLDIIAKILHYFGLWDIKNHLKLTTEHTRVYK